MRNRQLIAAWAMEMGRADNVIERVERDGKSYFVINDYPALRGIFGEQYRVKIVVGHEKHIGRYG